MFNAAIGLVCLLVLFAYIGWGWVSLFFQQSVWRPLFVQLFGMAIFLVVGTYVVYFDIQPIFALPVVLTIGTAGLIISFRKQNLAFTFPPSQLVKTIWIAAIAPLFVLYFETKDVFASQFSYRLGPDNLGWATSSAYLCRGNTVSDLTQSVQSQIGTTDLIESFNKPVLDGIFSINRISSYTDQVAAEFLIGAHRTGGQGMVASLCQVSGFSSFHAIFLAVICWSVLMVSLFVRAFAIEKKLSPLLAVTIGVITAINVNVLSVTFEGGFGQVLTLPFFLAAVLWTSRSKFKLTNWIAVSGLLVVAAASTYLDVLYLAAPFIFGTLLIRILVWKDVKLHFGKPALVISLFTLLAIIPILPHIYRLAIGPILRPAQGGWDQGNFPLLDNILGIASRLPNGVVTGLESRTPEIWVFDFVLSFLALAVFVYTFPKISLPFFPIVLGYMALIYSIYFTNPEVFNNYRIWKYSEYAATFFSIVLIDALAKYWSSKEKFFEIRHTTTRMVKATSLAVIISGLLLVQLSTSIIWVIDWKESSKVTLSDEGREILSPYLEEYDIQVVCGAFPTDYSIAGDLRYVDTSRGEGPVNRSVPNREKIYLIPPKSNDSKKCVRHYLSVEDRLKMQFLERNNEFQIFQINK